MENIPNPETYSEEKYFKLKEEFNNFFMTLNEDEMFAVMDERAVFGKKLQQKYPDDFSQYSMYHLLAGSTIVENTNITHEDFPGDDSVVKFIESLEVKYGQK